MGQQLGDGVDPVAERPHEALAIEPRRRVDGLGQRVEVERVVVGRAAHGRGPVPADVAEAVRALPQGRARAVAGELARDPFDQKGRLDRDAVDDPVNEAVVRVLDEQGELARVGQQVVPRERRRDVVAVLPEVPRDGLSRAESRAAQIHGRPPGPRRGAGEDIPCRQHEACPGAPGRTARETDRRAGAVRATRTTTSGRRRSSSRGSS